MIAATQTNLGCVCPLLCLIAPLALQPLKRPRSLKQFAMGRKKSTSTAAPQQPQAKPMPEKKVEGSPAKGQKGQKAQPAAKEALAPAANAKAGKKGGKK